MIDIPKRTPVRITEQIKGLCSELDDSQEPYIVPVKPEPDSKINECFFNVKNKVDKEGGQIQFGWIIYEWPKVWIEAEFHANWISPKNVEIDITPKSGDNKEILFLPDSKRTYDYKRSYYRINNIRKPISESDLILDLILFKQQIFDIEETQPEQKFYLEGAVLKQYEELQFKVDWLCHILMSQSQPPRSYDDVPCLCGSGKKYKNCCKKNNKP